MRFTLFLASAACALASSVLLSPPVPGQTPASASTARGKALFLRCASCHAVSASAPARIGPHLGGIVGRKGGSLPGYRYSKAMKAAAPVWNDANLDRWLAAPSKMVPGTSMAFGGMPRPDDRKALIAYLKKPR